MPGGLESGGATHASSRRAPMVSTCSRGNVPSCDNGRESDQRRGVRVVALALTDTYRAGLSPHLSHVTRVADLFHVTRVANRVVEQVRRRVQYEALGPDLLR